MSDIKIKINTISKSIRLPFLVLTPACMFLGWSIAIANQAHIEVHLLVLSLLAAMFAHISVNALNEYYDFKSGLDLNTKKTPFSGGSGALPERPEMANSVLTVGIFTLVTTLAIGAFFVWTYSWAIMPIGIAGLLLIMTYTGWVNRHPLICLIAPGLGFGFFMVAGANFALTGAYSMPLWLICLVPFFLVNNLLLLNQYPDIDADREVGRYHFPIAYGIHMSNIAYGLFAVLTMVVIVAAVVNEIIPVLGLIALMPMPLAFFALRGAMKYGGTIGQHPKYLAANVMITIFMPVLLAVSIIYG